MADNNVTKGQSAAGRRYSGMASSGLSMNQFRNPTNPSQSIINFQGSNPASNPNAVYLTEGKWAYMGTKQDPKTGKTQDTFMDIAGADVSYYFLSNNAKAQLRQQMDGLYGKGVWKESWIAKAYNRGLQASAYAYANMGTRVTAIDATAQLLAGDASNGLAPDGSSTGKSGGGGGYSGPVTTAQRATSVNLTDPMSARKLVDDALETYLGRRATASEQEKFLSSLNKGERKSPSVTTQVSTTTPQGAGMTSVESNVESKGGFNPSVFAEEFARGQQGAGEYQAATSLLDTFIDSLKARV
jgi:hypothetical protein